MRTTPLLTAILALVVASAGSGCIENMRDLKDRLSPAATTDVAPDLTDDAPLNATNVTKETPNPVARMTVFAESGALLYRATFVAEDPKEAVLVPENSNLTLIGSDSEALARNATLTKYAWLVDGKAYDGRQVKVPVGEPGAYPAMLVVTDSNGKTDMQTVTFAVAPTPFDVETTVTTDPVVGASGSGQGASFDFEVADTIEEKKHSILGIVFTTEGGTSCDTILTVETPDGTKMGPQDSGSDETISLGASLPGTYKVTVDGFLCAAPTGVPVKITISYVQIVEGLGAGDGHGGHAGH